MKVQLSTCSQHPYYRMGAAKIFLNEIFQNLQVNLVIIINNQIMQFHKLTTTTTDSS